MLAHATSASLENGLGVGSEDAKEARLRFDFAQCVAHSLILSMATDIDKKNIVPPAPPGRSGFDSCHVDSVSRERIQQLMQHARSFGTAGGQEPRSFVFPARRETLSTND